LLAIITYKNPMLEIDHNRNDEEFYKFETEIVLEKDKLPFDFDPYSNLNVNAILTKWGYFLRMTIG